MKLLSTIAAMLLLTGCATYERTPTQVMVDDYLASPSGQPFVKAMESAEKDSIPSVLSVVVMAAYYGITPIPNGYEIAEFVWCPPQTGPLPEFYTFEARFDGAAPNVPPQLARETPGNLIILIDSAYKDSYEMRTAGVVASDSTRTWSEWSTWDGFTGCGGE